MTRCDPFEDRLPCIPAHGYSNAPRPKGNPRSANGHRRRMLRKRVAAEGRPCALCGKPIDYSLPPGHPMAYELDEIRPVSLGGDPLDPANVQPAHRICNQRKGNGLEGARSAPRPAGGSGLPQSRDW